MGHVSTSRPESSSGTRVPTHSGAPPSPIANTMSIAPLVRLIVVNYNGGEMTMRCVERLSTLEWPSDRLEIVLIDNASTDGIANRVAQDFPAIRVVRCERNLGFAGGANEGLRDLGSVDFVGFVNNDAFPDPRWLKPLVEAMQADPRIGAAAPKILLAPRFLSATIRSATFRPGPSDHRELGVMVVGARCDDRDVMHEVVFRSGFHGPEVGSHGPFQWTDGYGELWFPFASGDEPPATVQVRLQAPRPMAVTASSGTWSTEVQVGPAPCWFDLHIAAPPFDVINNVGSRLVSGGWAGDRGFMEADRGQYEHAEEVFGWCGAAALLSRPYVDDLGGFDDELFLYYEDTDMSWRGRLKGWRYEYVPEAPVRHLHSATSGEGSALFNHYVDRNRLLVFLRNAPLPDAGDAVAKFVREMASITIRDVVRPTLNGGDPHPVRAKQKLRSFAAFVRHAPRAVRHRALSPRTVDRRVVAAWAERP